MTVKIVKNKNIYDVFLNDAWMISRGHPDNVMTYLAELTKESGPMTIEFVDNTLKA